jgi:hypothetical protein
MIDGILLQAYLPGEVPLSYKVTMGELPHGINPSTIVLLDFRRKALT